MEEDILNFLNENHGWNFRDLTDFLMERFPDPNRSALIAIRDMFESLVNSGLVRMKNQSYTSLGMNNRSVTTGGAIISLETIKKLNVDNPETHSLNAMLTSAGRMELQEIEFRRLTSATNTALEKSATASIKAGRQMEAATWIIAFATVANVIIAAAPHSVPKIQQSVLKQDTSKISNANSNKK
jgi:hypothetical protein